MHLLSRLHLKTKLIASMVVISVVAVLLTASALIKYEQYQSLKSIEEDTKTLAAVIANRSTAALIFSDANQAEANLKALGENPNVALACMYDSNEDIFAKYQFHYLDQTNCPDKPEVSSVTIDESVHIFEPITMDGLQVGTLYMNLSLDWVAERRAQQFLFIAVVASVILFISFFIASYLQVVLVSPIKRMTNTARNISQQNDFSLRADLDVRDDVGAMADVFNHMMDKIEDENQRLYNSEDKFRQLAALSPVGIFQIDLEHNITYVNSRWCDITGIHKPQASLEHWLSQIRTDDRRIALKAWTDLIHNDKPFVIEVGFDKAAEQTWTIIEAGALKDGNGDVYGYMGAISDITDLKNAQLKMEHLAFYDPLTGLSNRRLFKERLEKSIAECKRRGTYLALLFLDLDQFKRINDSLGHDAGDQLLIEAANRLVSSVRESDTVSRIGGDEFTVLLNDIESSHDVIHIAEKILKNLNAPVTLKNQEVSNSVSIGITLGPDDGEDANTLMRNADLAMYRAKSLGRNNFQFFSEEMNAEILSYLEIEKDLRKSLDNDDEFVVVYQPKIHLGTSEYIGAEALIRWKPSGKETISPDRFIPIAEETGLIVPIGKLVLRKACMEVKRFIDLGLWPMGAKMAVNLSAKQFSDAQLIPCLHDTLKTTGCPVEALELEITESTLMDNVESAILTMRAIKNMGVSIAIDDFGTGYSSLSYLKRFPIDVLKVDRSFVMDIPTDLNDMEITAAVIAMAHKLHLKVVAEGIESLEQMEFLKANHCEYGQGYLISPPVPAAELSAYIEQPFDVSSRA